MHRPRGEAGGQGDGIGRARGVTSVEHHGRQADRPEQRLLVDALVRDPGAVGLGDAVGDEHHRLSVDVGHGQAVNRAGGARASGGHAHAGGSGELAHDSRHDGAGSLGVHQNEVESVGDC